jgi:hypothetical protein
MPDKTTPNIEAARLWLSERRTRLQNEIAVMEGRRNEIDWLLSELDTPIAPMPPAYARGPNVQPTVDVASHIWSGKQARAIMQAMVDAGDTGLTPFEGRKIVQSMGIKIAASSFGSRMSNLNKLGKVDRIGVPGSRTARYVLKQEYRKWSADMLASMGWTNSPRKPAEQPAEQPKQEATP